MPVYLAMADVLVSPRAFGGNLPLKIFDYLAAGRPIVATDISTHRAVLTQETAVLVQPSAGALAEGIVSLLARSGAKRRELGEAARQYAFEHLGWSRFVRTVGRDLRGRAPPCPRLIRPWSPSSSPRATRPAASAPWFARSWRRTRRAGDRGDRGGRRLHRRYGRRGAGAAGARVLEAGAGQGDGQPGDRPQSGRGARRAATRSSFSMPTARPRRTGSAACSTSTMRGTEVVGGSLDLPPGLSLTARCDYYCGWYHVHSRREGGEVSNHPPGNLSVRRGVFARTGGFTEQQPIAYSHEELAWQAAVRRAGGRIVFDPGAHGCITTTAPGSAISCGATTDGATAPSRARRRPVPRERPGSTATPACSWRGACRSRSGRTAYILGCWLRARVVEPLLMLPAVLAARLAYSAGLVAGGIRWIRHGEAAVPDRPRWE